MPDVLVDETETAALNTWLNQHGEENAEKIALELLRRMPDSSYTKIPRQAFLNGARANHWLALGILKGPGFEWPDGNMSPRGLLESGFSVEEVIQSLLITIDALPIIVNENYHPAVPLSKNAEEWFSNRVRQFVAEFISEVINESKKQTTEAHRRVSMMLEVAQTVNSTLDLDEILKLASNILIKAAGASDCWFFLSQSIENAAESHQADLAVTVFSQSSAEVLELVRSILENRTIFIYKDTSDIEYPWAKGAGIKSVLGIPLLIKEQALGVALILSKEEDFVSAKQLELVEGITNVVSNALGNAMLLKKLQRLTILEERTRLAREIHDDLAQALGVLTMKIRTISDLLEIGDTQQAQAGIKETIQIGENAYSASRESLFNLNSTRQITVRFLPWLRKYLADYQLYFGMKTTLNVGDESAASFSKEIEDQISWIITEALSNIRKHAKASNIIIRCESDPEVSRITVEDDGSGFEPDKVLLDEGELHYGLQIMRERAQSFGGSITINALPEAGTTVIITIPHSEKMRRE
jgi:nitrate/nitrite-specific signal transduction histidine kinase